MYKSGDGLRFSPSDLIVYLDSDFASWMDRWHVEQTRALSSSDEKKSSKLQMTSGPFPGSIECCRNSEDQQLQIIARKGDEHEAAFVETLRRAGLDVVEIPQDPNASAATFAAMKSGRQLIYQGCLTQGDWQGYSDFLARQDGESLLGQHHYEVWDTKLARSPKPYFLIQLCAYAEMLEHLQGVRPAHVEVILGTNERRRFATNKFFYYYKELVRSFLKSQQAFDVTCPPDPALCTSLGHWSEYAERILEAADHVSCVARISRAQIKKLKSVGVETMSQLSELGDTYITGISSETLRQLKIQARLQIASRGLEQPKFESIPLNHDEPRRGLSLLPPASANDVFFDLEGYPLIDGGLEYLFGAVYKSDGELAFRDWWAHNAIEEKKAFEGFVDWAFERWKSDRSMHIYHYAAYEVAAMRRLMGRYATREQEVDQLLRNQVFVDLYTVVRQGVLVGTPSYSLKYVERLYLSKREGGVTTAGGSVVAYQHWLDGQDGPNCDTSTILKDIRDYNRIDCESLSHLADWLRRLQSNNGMSYISERETTQDDTSTETEIPATPAKQLANKLLAQIADGDVSDAEQKRVQELLAWMLEFHWREAKPCFWRKFDRHEMSEAELIDDIDCLGGLQRTATARKPIKKSWGYEYQFDPDQDTKLHEGCKCFFAHDLLAKCQIETLDAESGLVTIKLGPNAPEPPARLSVIPDEYVSADVIADAVYRYVESWSNGVILSRAVDDLVHRQAPRITGHGGGAVVDQTASLDSIVRAAASLEGSTLCIQGPPGTGKTFTAAAIIIGLLKQNKRVGVTATSHAAILNALKAVASAAEASSMSVSLIKVGGDDDDAVIRNGRIKYLRNGSDAASALDESPLVIGGTAWMFSRPEMCQEFDYLIVDEAGQFSLANAVATGLAAKNLILVGDQMQLGQPVQGSHPGESGKSALEYLLQDHATVPEDRGIFLGTTWRMHPHICQFISDAVYDGRLKHVPETARQEVKCVSPDRDALERTCGVVFVEEDHDGNSQCSEEEVDRIEQLVKQLIGRCVVARDGNTHELTLQDILIVAPFNMQVRRLQRRLGPNARVGSVDRFQGQEAAVVIVSMCASTADDSPRGVDFLLNKNRMNVAISRAKCLAIVVGCRSLMATRCKTIEHMELTNLYCWLADHSGRIPANA